MISMIVPMVSSRKANKKLKKKINYEQVEIPDNIEDIDIKYIEDDYNKSVDTKNRFEDKAKTIIAALTISITLILNISKIIESIAERYSSRIVGILVFIIALFSIVYMLMAGLLAIQVLVKENILFQLSLKDRNSSNKKAIYESTQNNISQNLIRNNMIYSAYGSIRNSVICLVVIFTLAVLPMQTNTINVDIDKKIYSNIMEGEVQFSASAVEWLLNNPNYIVDYLDVIGSHKTELAAGEQINIYIERQSVLISIKQTVEFYVIEDIKGNIIR